MLKTLIAAQTELVAVHGIDQLRRDPQAIA